jgi:hypothetical protein
MYWAISGNENENYEQGFKYVIKDEKFYNENVYKFLPSDFYSTNNSNPTFINKLDKNIFDKKLGGLATEKQCESIIALAPKVYSCYTSPKGSTRILLDNNKSIINKAKGVNKTIMKEINFNDYNNVLINKEIKTGISQNLQLNKNEMEKIMLTKNSLTAVHTKYKISDDFSTCLPLQLQVH